MEIPSDINEFIKNAESQKTVDKTKRDFAKFSEYLRSESVNERTQRTGCFTRKVTIKNSYEKT